MYTAAGQPDRNELVQRFLPLVKRVAYHLMARLPANVQFEDLVQNGMLGLLDAIDRFEEGFGAQFETYATQRVRGAMLDGLRANDWLPRNMRRELRRIEQAINRLEHAHGRAPSEQELADALEMSLADYQKLLQEARGHQLVYYEDFGGDDDEDFLERHFIDAEGDPAGILEDKDIRQNLVAAIGRLPEREKLMMALYYEQDLNLREIGEVMGVTESRVCQLHSQAIARLRGQLVGDVKAAAGKRRKGKALG
ncbi:RNA polymerase sigma-28 (SigD/FliA/WhiG) subunit [Azonexus fungiphilus]|jgi:RNA polymerase sigma factor for flagellar operon FliA|uniref:RNA polymerase sigma factor FliA n=1 Tax=Azonexus fungiphilus TaxID=146940 RepID=A0A495VLW4_9RHOO|nr:RNA polymerase sigma factor FliA [Azonexus fungiphilus]NHC07214.1 RNA polymerase sigma factor FliA [Azonexus fungiphilus]RKT50391.1 RNA polymerase sigma-28 (SigD/FliA/WhiG) subunit [Azonexus fungiphilus]